MPQYPNAYQMSAGVPDPRFGIMTPPPVYNPSFDAFNVIGQHMKHGMRGVRLGVGATKFSPFAESTLDLM